MSVKEAINLGFPKQGESENGRSSHYLGELEKAREIVKVSY
jgi:hypothetical protein